MLSEFRPAEIVAVLMTVAATAAIYPIARYAEAHKGATGVVKERMDTMDELSKASKTLTAMFKGTRPYDPKTVARLAGLIADKAEKLPKMFPSGSDGDPSEALPIVWSDPDGFAKGFEALKEEAGKLAAMAPTVSMREALPQFFKMSRTCTACHTDYRKAQ